MAAQTLIDLSPRPLPDPEQRMEEITKDAILAKDSYSHWHTLIETIAHAPDLSQLQSGFDDYKTASRRSGNVARVATYRAQYEQQYVTDMLLVVQEINPAFDSQVLRNTAAKLSQTEQTALRRFFKSAEWEHVFTEMIAHRGNGSLPTDLGKRALILGKAQYFKMAYEMLGISIFCDGARPGLKRKNDYNDIHQLIYVSKYTEDVVVTEDRGILSKIGASSGKVMSFTEFLQREAI